MYIDAAGYYQQNRIYEITLKDPYVRSNVLQIYYVKLLDWLKMYTIHKIHPHTQIHTCKYKLLTKEENQGQYEKIKIEVFRVPVEMSIDINGVKL